MSGDAVERKRVEERLKRLNAVLRAIRNVNQLITQEKDRDRLIREACGRLVAGRGYHNAWIALLDGGDRLVAASEAGLGEAFDPFVQRLQSGEWPPCVPRALVAAEPVIVQDPAVECPCCPLAASYAGSSGLVVRMEHAGCVYGVLALALAPEHGTDEEERSLLAEIAADLAFALHSIELEEERARAAKALRESEERYRAVFEGAVEGILVADAETRRFKYANPAICRMLGYSAEELVGLGVEDIHPPEELDGILDGFEAQVAGTKPLASNVPCVRKDGTVFRADINTALAVIDGRLCNIGFFRDVTEHRELEERLRRAQKLEAVGQLVGGIAHDFNNVLSAILGFGEFVLNGLPPGSPVRKDMVQVMAAANRAAALVARLLAFSRRQALEPRVLDLNHVLAEMEEMLLRVIRENIQLVMERAPDLVPVRVDPAQTEQVVMNLVVNACDAMPHGGRLVLRTENVDLDEKAARAHPDLSPGRYARLTVSDTGVGMDEETLRRAFEPFFTTKEPGRGSGLGLSTVYGIVRQSGGAVTVTSQVGRGSTFRVFFPEAKDAAVPPKRRPPEAVVGGTETILLAEDDPGVRQVAARILRGRGYTVLDAESGEAALRLAREAKGPVHLLLTDVVMPGLSGPELAEAVAASCPGIKAMYMSGYMNGQTLEADALRRAVVVRKPFAPDDLLRKVRQALDAK